MRIFVQFKRFNCILLLILFCSCISRNNPWDPLNGCPEEYKAEIREEQKFSIDSLLSIISGLNSPLVHYKSLIDSITRINSAVELHNRLISSRIDSLQKHNDSIQLINSSVSKCSQMLYKINLDNMEIPPYFSEKEIIDFRNKVETESLIIANKIAEGNNKCLPHGIYSNAYADSLLLPVKVSLSNWDSISRIARLFDSTIEHSNIIQVQSVNRKIRDENLAINSYNDSISKEIVYCGSNPILNSDELHKAISTLKPGDTLRIAGGNFSAHFEFSLLGNDSETIVVIGSPNMNTIFDPADVFISNCSNVRFYNLTFKNSLGDGLKIENESKGIYVENCTFTNNSNHGIEVLESRVELKNVRIQNNNGSGIKIHGITDSDYLFKAENILIAHNNQYGIQAITSEPIITHATISDNLYDGVRLEVSKRDAIFKNSLITFNGCFGITRDNTEKGLGYFFTSSTVFFGNVSGAMNADSIYLNYNIPYLEKDPYYVNKDAGDYHIGSSSPLYGLDIGWRD